MGFKENILQKIRYDQLHRSIVNSLGPPDSGRRLDKEAMARLLKFSNYESSRVRDLELYIKPASGDPPAILLLDNELKVYQTTPEDVALRKSPTVKEMVSIRNAIKILNDKDVVISRGRDTADALHAELVSALDLSFNPADLDALVDDGKAALENKYADGVMEILTIFMEILDWPPAPSALRLSHHHIWGPRLAKGAGETVLSPVLIYSLTHNRLCLSKDQVSTKSPQRQEFLHGVVENSGEDEDTLAGAAVWDELKRRALPQAVG
jgi:hypothetical protein